MKLFTAFYGMLILTYKWITIINNNENLVLLDTYLYNIISNILCKN